MVGLKWGIGLLKGNIQNNVFEINVISYYLGGFYSEDSVVSFYL